MKDDQYVIAIGASAGGINQINTFFDYTPLDGVSYIVIQHFSPDYKSMMAALLAKHSKLNVVEAENNMTIENNKIYLIPSKNVMTIRNNRLLLTDKHKGVNLTIDVFFNSLAEERGDKAIGIILSGTGSDGTNGMKAIKNAGGMLIASDPESAEFSQMPASAIATGLVDFVIPPDEMPLVIENYVNKKLPKTDTIIDEIEEEKTIAAITGLIKDKLSEDFSNYKKPTILRRIKRRALLHNLHNINVYLDLLKNDMGELEHLAKDFLISVTSFFRDKDAFQGAENIIVPEIMKNKQNDEIKIWVAGCATGEEAYSIAILVREQLDAKQKKNIVKIFATDVDTEALQIAGRGWYNESIEKDVLPQRIDKFFTWENDGYKIKKSIRDMLIFSHHDLVKNPPYCNMDFISCRNVLIYINPLMQKKILSLLHWGLRYGGYLLLGPSESVMDISPYLEMVDKKWKIYKNILAKRTLNFETLIVSPLAEDKTKLSLHQNPTNGLKKSNGSLFNRDTSILTELGYTGIWINEKNIVIETFGDSSRYLLPKMFVHDLPDLLSKSMQIAFRTATIEADKTNTLIMVKGITIEGRSTPVTLSVKPLITFPDGQLKRLLLFSENSPVISENQSILFDKNLSRNKYTENLEEELRITKEKIAAANELLNASTENMQSFNEELISANEEMQSTNEEMQSVNEELQTMNAEYQSKIRELSDLNDDLNNYFRSNVNGQIFLNKDLLLMKFSPGAATHINLLPNDIGRPLSNLTTNIRFETIDKDIREVLSTGSVVTKEIQAINGKWYQVMTMPYLRKHKMQPDGAVITFNDITELKQIQEELSKSNKSLKVINDDLDNFVYTASHDLLGPIYNIEHIIHFIKEKQETLDKETSEYIDMLSTSVDNFREVIKEMAAIGKIESEKFKLETINLEIMIEEILKSIEWRISSEGANIQTDLEVKNITFSKKNCRSMIFNLINNALKFKSPDRRPQIVITTKDLPDYTLLSIKDNGIGIEEDKVKSIFLMYKRLDDKAEGQGLGLFLINKIIDSAGGKIEVESKLAEGTEFKLFIKK